MLPDFTGGYGDVDELLTRARFWAGTLELQWALRGVRDGDPFFALAHLANWRDMTV
jgi:aminoglycoside 2''-phosphotransferase